MNNQLINTHKLFAPRFISDTHINMYKNLAYLAPLVRRFKECKELENRLLLCREFKKRLVFYEIETCFTSFIIQTHLKKEFKIISMQYRMKNIFLEESYKNTEKVKQLECKWNKELKKMVCRTKYYWIGMYFRENRYEIFRHIL